METLQQYIENQIIPQYAAFDGAHREQHAESVIAQAMELAGHYDVDKDMVLAAAACHDIGLVGGREKHHLISGKMIRNDSNLLKWFTPEQIETIAQAAEDHRASNSNPPRSIYGRIIAEADRLIDPDTVIRRTVQFGFAHYPEMNRRRMRERTVSHLKEKYGEGGYLKLWIPESQNARRLAELRKLIEDRDKLEAKIDGFYREEKYGPEVCERFRLDERYRNGHINIIAAKPGTLILGLHVPQMKAFAKENAKRDDWREILEDFAQSSSKGLLSHEERIIWGLTINYIKCDVTERLKHVSTFLPCIDNWAICDTFCCNAKWTSKRSDRETIWKYITSLLELQEEFTRRTGLILMLAGFLNDDYVDKCFETIDSMRFSENEPYYVKMAVAWLLATALAKFPERTRQFASSGVLPGDIDKLYVRKARESLRTRGLATHLDR